jgi:hypothetical protein
MESGIDKLNTEIIWQLSAHSQSRAWWLFYQHYTQRTPFVYENNTCVLVQTSGLVGLLGDYTLNDLS